VGLLTAFNVRQLSDARAMLTVLQRAGAATIVDAVQVIEQEMGDTGRETKKPGPVSCCQCGGQVSLYPVNVSRCTQIGGPWRTQIICRRCGRDILNVLTPDEIIRRREAV
jgi:ribosomal protein L37E